MAKVKIDSALFARVTKACEGAGYSSVTEFITHIIEKEVAKYEAADTDEETVKQRLRGLGYIE